MTTEQKTKELIRPMPATWWLKNPAYTRFMIRDITSVFIAGYCIFLMFMMCRAKDTAAFAAFYEGLRHPVSIVLHLLALAFAAYHSITFFNLTPRAIVVYRGDEKVPDSVIRGGHFALWAVASLVILVIGFLAVV